jgi:DNA-directed RNA polymerase specialized sigma24 family protein
LRENPGKTEADFNELKALSDEMYLTQVRSDNAQSKKTVGIHDLEETDLFAVLAFDEAKAIADEAERKTTARRQNGFAALNKLTEVQRRRYILHTVNGLTVREIGDLEQVHFTSIHESLEAAQRKIKKFLQNG